MKTFFSVLVFLFNINFLIQKPLFAETLINKDKSNPSVTINADIYLLGPGDLLEILIFGAKEISGKYQISNSGELNLPLIGLVNVDNLSVKQATRKLENRFRDELLRPDIYLKVLVPRPLMVSIVGEVQRPGLYSLGNEEQFSFEGRIDGGKGLPTVVDAIQKSGGITPSADLENVFLRRRLPGEDKEYKQAKLNLLQLIKGGDQTQNPFLFDGDILIVNKGIISDSELLKNSNSNLSPSSISVFITGNVVNPKDYQLKVNTPLIQALYQAGGPVKFKSNFSNVELIRLNNDGTITKKSIRVDRRKSLSSKNNPPLKNGDIVRVKDNTIGTVSGGIATITDPLSGLINAVTLFKLFN